MKRVLVVDPGKMTGAGFLTWEPGAPAGFEGFEMEHFEFLDWAGAWVRPELLDRVVCEGYKVTERTVKQDSSSVDGLWSVKQIGCLEFWCDRWGIPFVQQMPSDKSFAEGSAKLRAIGWWDGAKGEKGHRRDAARHAIVWGTRNNVIDPRRLLG